MVSYPQKAAMRDAPTAGADTQGACCATGWAAGANRTVLHRGKADARRPKSRRALRRSGHPGRVLRNRLGRGRKQNRSALREGRRQEAEGAT